MMTYQAAYTTTDGCVIGAVLDFPGTVSSGKDLAEARRNLADALLDMAESSLLDGEPLPRPNPQADDLEADLVEPIYLLLQTGNRIEARVAS